MDKLYTLCKQAVKGVCMQAAASFDTNKHNVNSKDHMPKQHVQLLCSTVHEQKHLYPCPTGIAMKASLMQEPTDGCERRPDIPDGHYVCLCKCVSDKP